jgi:neutral ceramidase
MQVTDRLKANPKYAGIYTAKNVVLSGTHTHSGPAGFMQYLLFDITSKGWVQQSFDSLVDGILMVNFYTVIVPIDAELFN